MARVGQVGNMLRRERGPKPLHVQRWAERYRLTVGVAQPAHQLAVLAEPFLDLLRQLQTPTVRTKLPPTPPLDEWIAFYERPTAYYVHLGNKVSRSSLGSRVVGTYTALADFVHVATRRPEETKAELAKIDAKSFRRSVLRGMRRAGQEYRKHLAELREELQDGNVQLRENIMRELERLPEMQFALEVFLPCLVHYCTTPAALLAKARKGDEEAIENLVRLDPLMAHEESICRWAHHVPRTLQDWRLRLIARCLEEQIPRVPNARAVKESAAGLVSLIAAGCAMRFTATGELRRYQLTAPMILELFHAVARDRGTVNVRNEDPDLSEVGAAAWAKSIQRHRKAWMEGLGVSADKN